MPRVLLIGPTGRGGPSDDASVTAFHRALPGWDLTLLAPRATIDDRHGVQVVGVDDLPATMRTLKASDAVVMLGHLRASAGRGLLPILAMSSTMLGSRPRLACLGVRIADSDSLRPPSRLVRGLVRSSELTILRDDASATTLLRLGIRPPFRVGTHLAWGAVEPRTQRAADDGRAILIVTRQPDARTGVERATRVMAAIRGVGLEPVLLPWRGGTDQRLAQDLAAGEATVLPPSSSFATLEAVVARATVVVSPVPTPVIAAAAAGVPSIGLAGDREARDLAARLAQPELATTAGPHEVAAAVEAAVAREVPAAAVRAEVATAAEMFRLFRLLLEDAGHDLNGLSGLRLTPEP